MDNIDQHSAPQNVRSEREITLRLLKLLNMQNSTRDLIRNVTGMLQEWTGCEAVGVRLREGDDFPYYETRGFPAEFVAAENSLCAKDKSGKAVLDADGWPVLECMCGNILRGRFDAAKSFFTAKGSFWSNRTTELLGTTTEADRQSRTRNQCNSAGYESVALIRLKAGDEVLGLLQLNDHAKDRFTPEMLVFVENLADQIAIALAQRKAQAALRESEQRYHSLFDNMLNGFAYCKMLYNGGRPEDFVYIDVNKAFEKLTGLKDVVGKRVTEVIPGIREADPELFEIYGRVALTGTPEQFEMYVAALKMWFSISVYCPEKEHFVAVFDVIDERKRAEEALRKSEADLKKAQQVAHVGSWVWHIQSDLLEWSDQMYRIFGIDRENFTGNLADVIARAIHPDDRAAAERASQSLANDKKAESMEYRIIHPDGTVRVVWAEVGEFILDDAGNAAMLTGIVQDITERKRAEEEKEHLQTQLFQSQKMEAVGRLAGGVAHDYNNMLSVIIGNADLAMKQVDPLEPLHGDLEEILAAAQRSAALTRQLLAFARKQTINPQVLNLNDAVSGMLKMLQRLIGEDIDLAWIPGYELWAVQVDPSQLDQILANLMVNARDAIRGVGRITIETENAVFDEAYCATHKEFIPGAYVLLAVSDDGRGMDAEILKRAFEPFFTTKGLGEGTGLGLSTVYGIVRQNRGFINVYSEPEKGTTLKIYLPRFEGDAAEARIVSEPAALKGGGETVLLVEDEAAILKLGKRILEGLGYTVLAAGAPEQAISLAGEHAGDIHLLITDVVMPEMNGRELAEKLVPIKPGLKCLFMSGYTGNVIVHHGVLEEGMHFLQKPFSLDDLAHKVREVLDG